MWITRLDPIRWQDLWKGSWLGTRQTLQFDRERRRQDRSAAWLSSIENVLISNYTLYISQINFIFQLIGLKYHHFLNKCADGISRRLVIKLGLWVQLTQLYSTINIRKWRTLQNLRKCESFQASKKHMSFYVPQTYSIKVLSPFKIQHALCFKKNNKRTAKSNQSLVLIKRRSIRSFLKFGIPRRRSKNSWQPTRSEPQHFLSTQQQCRWVWIKTKAIGERNGEEAQDTWVWKFEPAINMWKSRRLGRQSLGQAEKTVVV